MKKRGERSETLMRILIFFVSGIVFFVWRYFIYLLILANLIYTLFTGKRLKDLAELSEVWNTQWYVFHRYIIFMSDKRPFPFGKIEKNMSKFK